MTEQLYLIINMVVNAGNNIVWTFVLIPLLICAGVFFTYKLGFIQFTNFFHIFFIDNRKSIICATDTIYKKITINFIRIAHREVNIYTF